MGKYGKSLFKTEDGTCFLCKYVGQTARHEVIYGMGNREQSQKYGLWICVCPRCHDLIHANPKQYERLKKYAQLLFEDVYGKAFFYEIYRRNYL